MELVEIRRNRMFKKELLDWIFGKIYKYNYKGNSVLQSLSVTLKIYVTKVIKLLVKNNILNQSC